MPDRRQTIAKLDFERKLVALQATKVPGSEEYVGRVCRDAVERLDWSRDRGALKVIFVCGNEPASQDPLVKLKDVGELAKKKGVVIDPIFCGPAWHGRTSSTTTRRSG